MAKKKEQDWLAPSKSDNPVWAAAKGTARNYRSMFSSTGIPMDMGVAARNAGSLATPTIARAAGYNKKLTETGIKRLNKAGRTKVGTEMTKNMVFQLGMPVGPIRGTRMIAGAVKASKASKAAASARPAAKAVSGVSRTVTRSTAASKKSATVIKSAKTVAKKSTPKPVSRTRVSAK